MEYMYRSYNSVIRAYIPFKAGYNMGGSFSQRDTRRPKHIFFSISQLKISFFFYNFINPRFY